MSLSQPIASICFFSSSVRYFSASFFSHSAGNVRLLHRVEQALQPLEHGAEHAIELVEIALVLHQRRCATDSRNSPPSARRDRRRAPPSASDIRAGSPGPGRRAAIGKELQEHGLQIARSPRHVKGGAPCPQGLDLPAFSTRIGDQRLHPPQRPQAGCRDAAIVRSRLKRPVAAKNKQQGKYLESKTTGTKDYVATDDLKIAVNASIVLERPLLKRRARHRQDRAGRGSREGDRRAAF